MMALVPFAYFTFLTFYWWKKHKGVDICVYMSGLYAISAFCAILIVQLRLLEHGGVLFDEMDLELNVVPTALFILLLTLSILPFSLIHAEDIKTIKNHSPFILDFFCWMLIALSLLNFYLVADSTLDILGGDLEAIRQAHYEGILTPAQIKAESMPFFFRLFYYLNNATLLALPLSFYFVCVQKDKHWWFNALLFFASLSVPIAGIQAADRTEIMFYILMFIYCVLFFRKTITRKMKRWALILGTPFFLAVLVYIVAVSQARFEENEGGASASAVEYAGQGYLNFCFFWEKQNTDDIATEREFPLINHVLFKIDSNSDRRSDRSGKQGFFISVFPTFVGDILLDLGFLGVSIWVIYFFLLGMLLIKSAHRTEFHIGEILAIFVLAAIPIFGVFYYRYFAFTYSLMIILTFIIYFLSAKRITLF
jgi:oligosaccharide repeat unit polymerase